MVQKNTVRKSRADAVKVKRESQLTKHQYKKISLQSPGFRERLQNRILSQDS